MTDKWKPTDVEALIMNPVYVVTVDPVLTMPHEPLVAEDVWVTANMRLLQELGPESYLRRMLRVLAGDFPRAQE